MGHGEDKKKTLPHPGVRRKLEGAHQNVLLFWWWCLQTGAAPPVCCLSRESNKRKKEAAKFLNGERCYVSELHPALLKG